MTRSGRRPGTSQTRDEILAVARGRFADRGYDATSLRSIAAEAGVDPALVIHYFGSKEGLFIEAMGMPSELPALFRSLAGLDTRSRLEALVRGYVRFSDSDDSRNAMIALVRSAMSSDKAAAMLREFMTAELLPAVAGFPSGPDTGRDAGPGPDPDARFRASLVAAQLIGIAMLRHVVKIAPLATATPDDIVALTVPVLEGYFQGLGERLPCLVRLGPRREARSAAGTGLRCPPSVPPFGACRPGCLGPLASQVPHDSRNRNGKRVLRRRACRS